MNLRIPFYTVHYTPDFFKKTYTKESINRLAVGDLDFLKIYEYVDELIPVYNDCNEIISYNTNTVLKEVFWVEDPQDLGIALANFDFVNINDSKRIRIEAQYSYFNLSQPFNNDWNNDWANDVGSDWSDDWSNEFVRLEGIRRTFYFENDFEIYGYDLGNNFWTSVLNQRPNPDFNIYFVMNRGQFGCDFNWDFNYAYDSYANAIVYRKPFTNEIYAYDNTSSDYKNIKWWAAEQVENPTECHPENNYIFKDKLFEGRNVVICSDNEITIGVSKATDTELIRVYEYQEREGCCNCGCPPSSEVRTVNCQYHENFIKVPKKKIYFPKYELFVENECFDTICTNKKILNTAKTYIQYYTEYFNVNDELKYPFKSNLLTYKLIDKSGNVLDSKSFNIENFNDYNSTLYNYQFYIPDVGDYIVEASLVVYNYDDKELVTCSYNRPLKGKHWITYDYTSCNTFLFKNCSFETTKVKIEKLIEKKGKGSKGIKSEKGYEWKLVDTFFMFQLKEEKYSVLEDGTYKITFTREDDTKEYVFVENIYCKLQECIKKITDDLICNPPCDKRYNHNFESLNVIIPLSTLFFQKLHKLHVDNYYFEAIDTKTQQELYDLQMIYEKLSLYCYNCERLKITDCGC